MSKVDTSKLKTHDCVIIAWHDVVSDSSWSKRSEVLKEKATPCFTCAFYIGQNENDIIVASNLNLESLDSDFTVIPKCLVVAIWVPAKTKVRRLFAKLPKEK